MNIQRSISVICLVIIVNSIQSYSKPQLSPINGRIPSIHDRYNYQTDQKIVQSPARRFYFQPDGSPVEDALRTLMALKHHSAHIETVPLKSPNGPNNYKVVLDQMPRGIAPIMKHVSKLVHDDEEFHPMKKELIKPDNRQKSLQYKTNQGSKAELVGPDVKKLLKKEKPKTINLERRNPHLEALVSPEIVENEPIAAARGVISTDPEHEDKGEKV